MRFRFLDRISWGLGLLMLAAGIGLAAEPTSIDWGKAADVNRSPKLMVYKSVDKDDQGQPGLSVVAAAVPGAKTTSTTSCVAFTWPPFQPPADSAGISFEAKGNGSPHFGSVFVGPDGALLNGFEAFFPLDGTNWQAITLRWREFVKNDLLRDANAKFSVNTLKMRLGLPWTANRFALFNYTIKDAGIGSIADFNGFRLHMPTGLPSGDAPK
jgi:hypothetical protein